MFSNAGLDFGNKHCVVSVFKDSSMQVITDEMSNRLIPTMVSFTEERRISGSTAQAYASTNYKSTVDNLKRLVCLAYDTPERELIEQIVHYKLAKLEDGNTGVVIKIKKEQTIFRPEQLIAFLLKQLLKTAQNTNEEVTSFVAAVSPWWSEMHRRALLNAFKIADIPCISLINSTTAAAITYMSDKRNFLPEESSQAVPILFIDFGDSSYNVAVAMLSQKSVEIKSFSYDEHLGGSHFTTAFENYLIGLTEEKYKVNPTTNKKFMIRFRQAAEKAKRNLSINKSIMFEVMNLSEDKDVSFVVKVEEFEEQIKPFLNRLESPIQDALAKAGISSDDLFAVELLGGGSRVPAVRRQLKEIIGRDPTATLNLDECFAVGSGYAAAMQNRYLRVQFDVRDVSPHSVEAFFNDAEGKKRSTVFKVFSGVPAARIIKLRVQKECSVSFVSDEREIGVATVFVEGEDPIDVSLECLLNQSGVLEVIKVFKYKEPSSPLAFDYRPAFAMPDAEIGEYRRKEALLQAKDDLQKEIDERRNELEGLIYQCSDVIRNQREYFDPRSIEEQQKELDEISNWFSEFEFERKEPKEYSDRTQKIKKFFDPSNKRRLEWTNLIDVEASLRTQTESAKAAIDSSAMKGAAKAEAKRKVDEASSSIKSRIDEAKAAPRHQMPPVKADEVRAEIEKIEKDVREAIEAGTKRGWCRIC